MPRRCPLRQPSAFPLSCTVADALYAAGAATVDAPRRRPATRAAECMIANMRFCHPNPDKLLIIMNKVWGHSGDTLSPSPVHLVARLTSDRRSAFPLAAGSLSP